MNGVVSLKRKSLESICSPSQPSPKRVALNSPPPSTAAAAAIAAVEDGSASISPITSPSPAFSPFSKRVSEKSPFATTNAAGATAATHSDATAASPLPFSRFTKMQQPNNNKNLRRTLSEPPIFNSFTDFCRYMNSQSPEKNSSIFVKSTLRRSISDPTAADIILAPAPAAATPALTSQTGHEEPTRSKKSS